MPMRVKDAVLKEIHSSRTHVEVVEPCAVDVDEDLSGARLRLRSILSDGDLGRVCVVGYHESTHVVKTLKSWIQEANMNVERTAKER